MKGDQKWYQNPFVWLIIGGPLLVVVASFITLYLAITHPDPAIDDYYRKGIEINKTLDAQGQESQSESMAPAIQARNHAQTGLKPAEE
ncbi:MAG: nitrogen fixation protein FixH [Methylophilus methylotrophus]|uniref:Nitrogen fixation protein FixH n=1 Tax=Methylophilus methylotrophus TaxID=17 RepID=A0A5C7WHD7_METME|nr:MAG: nitrogen fixation protein FixH [Methylophilus methylotrophus]